MKKIVLFPDVRKVKALETARLLKEWLISKKIHSAIIDSPERISTHLIGVDLIVSLGGDGTVLLLANAAAPLGIPILAVDLGGLGFLATFPPSSAKKALSRVIQGNYTLDERIMLSTKIVANGKTKQTLRALNEVVVHNRISGKLVHLRTRIGTEEATTYSADGLIIATPTGSTAYSLSAGGPIVSPALRAFVITPISPHALASRPIVVSATEPIVISSLNPTQKIFLTADGKQSLSLQDETIQISPAKETCKLVLMKSDFYYKLKTKLKWAGEYKMQIRDQR